jgi:Collagen triple helix repeat (20 copies)
MKSRLFLFLALPFAGFVLASSCKVDESGLGTVSKLPFDGGATGSAGSSMTGGAGTGSGGTTSPITGAAGDVSSTGTAGTDAAGTSGAGTSGTGTAGTGAAGTASPGTAGTVGAAGDGGGAGTNGTAGTGAAGTIQVTGTAGALGTAGILGTAGVLGTAGTLGIAGTSGGAGTNGTAGTQGAAGTSGAAGTTPPVCGPGTCPNGCCANGKCVDGTTKQSCGTKGVACATCGACQLCTEAGVCDVNPSSDWSVVCGSASVAMTTPGGAAWDPHAGQIGGVEPDPFCQFEMPSGSDNGAANGVTTNVIDSYAPVWNATVTATGKTVKASDLMSTSTSKGWRLWVGDADSCCTAQEICEITQPLPVSALNTGTLTRQNVGSCTSLTVKFVCQD